MVTSSMRLSREKRSPALPSKRLSMPSGRLPFSTLRISLGFSCGTLAALAKPAHRACSCARLLSPFGGKAKQSDVWRVPENSVWRTICFLQRS